MVAKLNRVMFEFEEKSHSIFIFIVTAGSAVRTCIYSSHVHVNDQFYFPPRGPPLKIYIICVKWHKDTAELADL